VVQSDTTLVRTVPVLLQQAAARWPDKPYLIGLTKSFSFAEARAAVEQLAAWLVSQGLQRGDRVALWMSNRPEWVIAQLAVSWAGGILVPVNVRLRHADLAAVLRRSGSRFVIISGVPAQVDYAAILTELVDGHEIDGVEQIIAIDGHPPAATPFVTLPEPLPWTALAAAKVGFDEPAYLMYTSGTTSAPKGVILTYRSLGNAIKTLTNLDPGEIVSFEFPLAAITGCHNSALGALYAGVGLIVHDGRNRAAALELARSRGATAFAGHRLLLRSIADDFAPDELPRYRTGHVFPADPSDRRVCEKLGIKRIRGGYGMTETAGPVVTFLADVSDETPTYAFGRPAYAAQVRIVAKDGTNRAVGERGEILVKGPQLMAGYWDDPAATAAALDADGWLHTGDLGYLRDNGELVFLERFVDTYKCMGFNVSPGEVEDVIKKWPGVKDCTVVGVPDRREGAKGIAFITPEAGTVFDTAAVLDYVHGQLASFKVPRDIVLVDDVPRTVTGKPRRRELAARYVERAAPG
jgi:acyl-CoA synthetase (AMP-forming)/AMP-acid ligase II